MRFFNVTLQPAAFCIPSQARHNSTNCRKMSLCSQYGLRSVYPAAYTHIGQEFGFAVAMDTSGALFVGAPNQLTSAASETQNGAVHVLQLHSPPIDSASQSHTAVNSLSPLNKPVGTSCASLLQQVHHSPSVFLTRMLRGSCLSLVSDWPPST